MSRFKKQERVQIITPESSYCHRYGTVIETANASVRLIIDGEDRASRFWDTELIPAPNVPEPGKELARTQAYLRELEEDAKLLFDAADLLPKGNTKSDVLASAEQLSKITATFRLLLKQDGVTPLETEDAGK